MKTEITKAVIPVAGLGTRLRPLTYHQPKGMVGIADKPIIHYLVDELVAAGIRHVIFITSEGQHHFQIYIDALQTDSEWRRLGVKFDFALQKELKGSADALLSVEKFLDNEPFLVYFGDDLLAGPENAAKRFIETYQKTKTPVMVLQKMPAEVLEKYGVVKPEMIEKNLYKILDVVEKPKRGEAPSDIASMGRYVLTTEIFDWIRKAEEALKEKRELPIAEVLRLYIKEGGAIYGWLFEGEYFDTGSKLGLFQAQAYYGLQHPEFKEEFRKYLNKTLKG